MTLERVGLGRRLAALERGVGLGMRVARAAADSTRLPLAVREVPWGGPLRQAIGVAAQALGRDRDLKARPGTDCVPWCQRGVTTRAALHELERSEPLGLAEPRRERSVEAARADGERERQGQLVVGCVRAALDDERLFVASFELVGIAAGGLEHAPGPGDVLVRDGPERARHARSVPARDEGGMARLTGAPVVRGRGVPTAGGRRRCGLARAAERQESEPQRGRCEPQPPPQAEAARIFTPSRRHAGPTFLHRRARGTRVFVFLEESRAHVARPFTPRLRSATLWRMSPQPDAFPSDIEIARNAPTQPITTVAESIGIPASDLVPYGSRKAKVSLELLERSSDAPTGKLVLVTAISPTPAGEGKTTMTVGLGDGLARIGKKTMICLREPSLGPCFGMKGGAAGGGRAQVVPMEDINLHFTGDFHAISIGAQPPGGDDRQPPPPGKRAGHRSTTT